MGRMGELRQDGGRGRIRRESILQGNKKGYDYLGQVRKGMISMNEGS